MDSSYMKRVEYSKRYEATKAELEQANQKLYCLNVAFYTSSLEDKRRREKLYYAIKAQQNRVHRLKCKLHFLHQHPEEGG